MAAAARRREPDPVTLDPVRPNAGLEAWYRRELDKTIEAMQRSVTYWLKAAYRANEPEVVDLAGDESPAKVLQREVQRLTRRWDKEFRRLAERIGPEFGRRNRRDSDNAFRAKFKAAGFTVRFQPTRAMNDVMQATVAENVSLIRSIPEQYMTQVEGLVMRSVQQGRDMGSLSEQLQERLGVTKRRAALIARDQNEKATSAFNRVRMMEIGVEEAIWMHSHGGKEPRPSHVAMNGKRFDPAKGMWDPDVGEWVQPGELINCRCVSRAVIEGFS